MTNKNPDTSGIKAVAKQKREMTLQKVLDALKIMQSQSIAINFNSVSNFSGVTKQWLYNNESIKELINDLRSRSNNMLMKDQAVQLSIKNKEIDTLTKQNRLLRKQIEGLKKQLEVAYAEIYRTEN